MRHNLSDTNELIRDRRSISPKNYSSRKVHREVVEEILRNATWAPTHGMTQPWRFTVFIDEGKSLLSEIMPEKYSDRIKRSSVIVGIGMSPDPKNRIPEIEEIQAVACAVQNMYLTCTAHGIGGFLSTPKALDTAKMRKFMGLPEGGKCLGLFYMGYPINDWPTSHRKPLEYVSIWVDKSGEQMKNHLVF